MAIFPNAERDAADLAKLVNEDTDVTTRYGANPKKSFLAKQKENDAEFQSNLAGYQNQVDGAIDKIAEYAPRVVGDFTDGFEFTNFNEVGRYDDGLDNPDSVTYWSYNGALPFTVPADTVPTSPTYNERAVNNHGDLINRNAVGAHDDIYTRKTTIAEVSSGVFSVGDTLEVTDRAGAKFKIVSGGSANGFDIIDAGNGKTASIQVEPAMNAASFGLSPALITNDDALQSLINRIKLGGCIQIKFESGVFNFQCFDELTRGRAAVELRDISGVEFIGGLATVFKSKTGGFGTDPFSILRLDDNTKNIKFKGIEFNGDYTANPEFHGQTANRANGVTVATWDFSAAGQDSYEDYSIDGVEFLGCRFVDIGGGISTQVKSNLTERSAYCNVKVEGCEFIDAQQSNNSIGAAFAGRWKVTRNRFKTTKPLSDTVWTLAVDMSRGGTQNEVSWNEIDKYHFGIKCEYFLTGGVSGDEIQLSEDCSIHNNTLTDIGHPTLDSIGGQAGSGSYAIRMSGNNIVERDNNITGLFNAANVGNERRMFLGVWSNQVGVTGTLQHSVRGKVSNAILGVNHNSSDSTNEFYCKGKKIRDCGQGMILQAGGRALKNNIKRIQGVGIRMQIIDETFVKENIISETMVAGGVGAAIYGEPSTGDSIKYWEVIDNDIDNVDSGAGTAVIINSGNQYQKPYKYRAGRISNVSANENVELVSDVTEDTPIKAGGVINPATLVKIKTKNVLSVTNVDANIIQINFLKPLPSATFTIDAREPNNASIQWINFGTTTTYVRLRAVNTSNTPVALPSSLMFTVT